MQVKNIIFDLGGVILDLSVEDTLTAFSNLSGLKKEKVKDIFIASPEFNEFEKGLMDDHDFRDFIRKTYAPQATNEEIDRCWNAMLLGLPIEKLELLQSLKKQFSVCLLSNTNGIHLHHINEVILKKLTGKNSLDEYFHKAYYSHRMGKRKPEPEIYLQVLQENNLTAGETMFLDDNAHNIESAASLGIQTVYVHHPDVMIHTSTQLIQSKN
jgi:glucose-1-phosphatase